MKKSSIFILSLIIIIFFAVGGFVLAQPTTTEATLLVTDGTVVVHQSENFLSIVDRPTNLVVGDLLLVQQGDTVEVGANSAAMLTIGDGTSAELFADSKVQVAELFEDDDTFRVRLSLLSGKMVNRVQRLLKADDAYEVQTPSSTASVRGTIFTVDVVSEQETFVRVDEGVVAVQLDEQEVMVPAGFEVTAVTGQPLQSHPHSSLSADQTQTETAVDNPESASTIQENNVIEPQIEESVPVSENGEQSETSFAEPEHDVDDLNEAEESGESKETADILAPTAPDQTQPEILPSAVPSEATATDVPPADTSILPTNTPVPQPTNTPVPPPTSTSVPPPTNTPVPPPTSTPVPPPTNTPVPPPTSTPVPPPTEEPKVTLCHNGNTIEVAASAVQAHLDHGDTLGPCP